MTETNLIFILSILGQTDSCKNEGDTFHKLTEIKFITEMLLSIYILFGLKIKSSE